MRNVAWSAIAVVAGTFGIAGAASAIQVCELDGKPINLNNGYDTAGKSGIVRCRDGEGGPIVREQELQGGKSMGVMRYFQNGVLEKEYRVNERGNREGLSREWAVPPGGGKPVLVKEETLRNGSSAGKVRSWYPSGQLRRVTWYGEREREEAFAEFTQQGRLYELQCGKQPLLGPEFDDAAGCGYSGKPAPRALYGGNEQVRARVTYEQGTRRLSEVLWDSGAVKEREESGANEGSLQSFAADGTKRREVRWAVVPGERPRRVNTLEQEYHESGKLVRERRWRVGERGGELVSDARFYLNGQPKERSDFVSEGGQPLRRQTDFYDNGGKSFEGSWLQVASGSRGGETPTGTHRSYDAEGHLRGESFYDARGRISRERELDARGTVISDDEVFEDGSRKAFRR